MRLMRRGFSLVELLVVVAVLGLLAGLLLPAVQAARVAARESQCRHNLHEFGVYVAQHTNGKGRMPAINPNGPIHLKCPEVVEVVDPAFPFLAIYSQRFHGSTRDYAMNETGLASVDVPIVFDPRKVHDKAVLALFLDGHVERYVEPSRSSSASQEEEDGE